jgi:hypothetical protein
VVLHGGEDIDVGVQPWGWRLYVSPKGWCLSTSLRGFATRKTNIGSLFSCFYYGAVMNIRKCNIEVLNKFGITGGSFPS